MNKNGPIIIIDDDRDDHEMFADIFKNLHYTNEVVYFFDGAKALEYLNAAPNKPFLILSDINLPVLGGIELRQKLHHNDTVWMRCVPYIYFTTVVPDRAVIEAYSQSVQGFFVKPNSFDTLERIVKSILDYWGQCIEPRYPS